MIKLFSHSKTEYDRSTEGLCLLSAEELYFLPFAEDVSSDGILSLAKSISMLGLLEPVTVRRRGDGNFEVVCGQKRVHAARLAGMTAIPCLVAELSDSGAYAARLSSVIHSGYEDVFLVAELIGSFCSTFRINEQQAAVLLGISRKQVSKLMRLLSLSSEQRQKMSASRLTEEHAELILRQPLDERDELIDTAARNQLSPKALGELIRSRAEESRKKKSYLRRAAILSDKRLFFNTVNKAIGILRLAGVDVSSEKRDGDGFTELVIRFPEDH